MNLKERLAKGVKSLGSAKPIKNKRISRSPLRDAWSKAISKVDTHSASCKRCNTRRNDPGLAVTVGSLTDPHLDPYRQCLKALALEAEEKGAREAYRGAGGLLPAMLALLLLLAPLHEISLFSRSYSYLTAKAGPKTALGRNLSNDPGWTCALPTSYRESASPTGIDGRKYA